MGVERIQFVDSISATATVRLTLSQAPWTVLVNGTDASPPPLRRAVAQTLLTDGAIIPAAAYDNRTIRLHLQLKTSDTTVSATQLQLLHRELDRPTNILRWQPDPALPPVYFRTFRAPDYDPGGTDHGIKLFEFMVSIPAEPFALGLMETITPVAISNDPAAGSNGRFMDITAVKGDVETPLIIKVPGASVTGKQGLFAIRRRGTPSAMPFFLQTEAMTMGTDTATSANTSAHSGAGNNNVTCTFATNTTSVVRLSTTTFPASPSVDVRGTYRVFGRFSSGTTSFSAAGILEHGIRATRNAEVTWTQLIGGTYQAMIDLGLIQIPEGFDPVSNGPDGVALSVVGVPLKLYVRRISGSGNFVSDYLLFVPADDKMSIVNWGVSSPSQFVFDGTSRAVYGLDGSGRVDDIAAAYFVGDPPMVSPTAVTNRLVYVNDVSPTNSVSDGVATTVTLSPFYFPRYLSVRPVAS